MTEYAALKGVTLKECGADVEAANPAASNNAWIKRSGVERRSGEDQRRKASRLYFLRGGKERRRAAERRQTAERRDGWLQVGKWCSVCIFDSLK
jgi:hypothetical protein